MPLRLLVASMMLVLAGCATTGVEPVIPEAAETIPARIIVAVQAGNHASCRALERTGFIPVTRGEMTPDNPADDREHVIYRLDKSTGETR